MKRLILLLTLFSMIISVPSFAQGKEGVKVRKNTLEYVKEHYTKREVRIPMRDGVELFTSIYEPVNKAVKHPILVTRTCYSVAPYGENEMRALTSPNVEIYVENEYIFVYQDVRGKNMSGGDFDDIRPFIEGKKLHKKAAKNVGQTDEASDTYDTVEWLIHHTNNNGCVGAYGISYPGFYTTMVGLSGHPAVKAVSPQAPVTDWFHGDDVHHNGAFMLGEMIAFQPFFEYMMSNKYVLEAQGKDRPTFHFPELFHTDLYTDYLRLGTYQNICNAYGDSLEYLRTVREHPDWDEYWESHTVTKGHMHDVKPAVMVVGGLFDKEDCYGAFDVYKSIKEQSPETDLYLVEGPWYHGAWSRGMTQFFGNVYFGDEVISEYYIKNIEYPFFAYYLEGKGEKPRQEALMFDSGSLKWISYPEGWPLVKRSEATPFYLHADGKVSVDKPVKDGRLSYVSDPAHPVPYRAGADTRISYLYMVDDQRFAAQRSDVLTFCGDVLTAPMQLAGEIEVDLQVDLSTTDADFVVKVIDVFPDDFSYRQLLGEERMKELKAPRYTMAGFQLMVRGEVMRGKYRESFSEPKPFEPGKTTRVKFTMPDVSHTFEAGHRLMIQIQSSWFPLVDRNPQTFCNIYTCDEQAYQPATIGIHCEANAPSIIKLPVVKR